MQYSKKQFYDSNDISYLPNVGAKILSLLNGVKQTVPNFAKIHNLDEGLLLDVVQGLKGPTAEIRTAIDTHGPLRVGDLYPRGYRNKFPVIDDTKDGVVICRAKDTKKTERNTYRGPEEWKALFYTYADTAMSKTSLFRPEWIKELFIWNKSNPESLPSWAFNHGHFEHQITYFIGPVNFHWISLDGSKHVYAMNTGDVNYITPFVPHAFTTRKEGEGLILAVTYGGAVASDKYQAQIQGIHPDEYIEALKMFLSSLPYTANVELLDVMEGVMIRSKHESDDIHMSRELISGIPFQSKTRAIEINLRCDDFHYGVCEMVCEMERWGYNLSDARFDLLYGCQSQAVYPGDSFFIKPGVDHSFCGRKEDCRVLVIDIIPDGDDPAGELALIRRYSGERGLRRVHTENTQWF
jgi:hypothetical protein